MRSLSILWKFSRPHTIVGSIISIFTLYTIICAEHGLQYVSYLVLALIIGISCNIFIVGINQIADVEIDKINKPYLPIPSGVLSVPTAKRIVLIALFLSLGLALYVTPPLFGIIALAATIGWAYSMPPLYLKKHHLTAALAIAMVRGVLLNAGGFLVFNYLVNHSLAMPQDVKILTLFIILFSIVISWFKDLSDMKGDAQFNIHTFALSYSPKATLIAGNLLVGLAYLLTIYAKYIDYFISGTPSLQTEILLIGHIILFNLFIINGLFIKLSEHHSITRFYKRFWWFFFAEYVVYLLAYTVKS